MSKRKNSVDVLQLIAEVKKHDCLWDFKYRNRRGTVAVTRAWVSISNNLRKSAAELRAKWKNLKDAYRKEMKKNYFDGEYQGIWQYFEALDFLKDAIVAGEKIDDDETNEEIQEMIEAKVIDKHKLDNAVIKLIVEVKKHECLWNNNRHINRVERGKELDRAWLEVANNLGKKVDDIRTKWDNLRYFYRREVQKNFSNGEYKGTWQYFNLMTFVKVEFICNTEFDEPLSEDGSDEEPLGKLLENKEIDTIVKTETESIDERIDAQDYLDTEEDLLPEKRQKTEDEDEYDLMFLKSLTPFFKGMDNVRKLILRGKIQEMVMNELANAT